MITLTGGDNLSAGINLEEDPDEKGGGKRRRRAAVAQKDSQVAAGVLSTLWC